MSSTQAAPATVRRPEAAPLEVSVLVVTYGNPELTRACLDSVFRETAGVSCEVVVVDNDSPDATAEMIAREHPAVRLFALDENLGFARANNLAAEHAVGEYLLLLNPDTEVHPGAVRSLIDFARAAPERGLYGGRTLTADGVLDPRSCWGRMTVWSLLCFATGLSTLFAGSRIFDPESLGRWQRDSVREVGVVTGCLLLVRRDVWRELGGFDSRFFMYGEDSDLSNRARARGYRPSVTPAATITHVAGASSGDSGPKLVQLLQAKATLVRRQWRAPVRHVSLSLLLAGVALRAAAERLTRARRRSSWRHAWRRRNVWLRGYDS